MVKWAGRKFDVIVYNQQGICWVTPETDAGEAWTSRNLPANWERHVQHHPHERYYELEEWFCDQIVDRMRADGLKLSFPEPIDWAAVVLGQK